MNKAFEKILERLEKLRNNICGDIKCCECKYERICNPIDEHYEKIFVDNAVKIVKEVAKEYNDGWIPVSERLPDDAFGCLVTVIDCEPVTQNEFENILPYFVGYDGSGWIDSDGEEIPFEVIAWQQLPEPYKENE